MLAWLSEMTKPEEEEPLKMETNWIRIGRLLVMLSDVPAMTRVTLTFHVTQRSLHASKRWVLKAEPSRFNKFKRNGPCLCARQRERYRVMSVRTQPIRGMKSRSSMTPLDVPQTNSSAISPATRFITAAALAGSHTLHNHSCLHWLDQLHLWALNDFLCRLRKINVRKALGSCWDTGETLKNVVEWMQKTRYTIRTLCNGQSI